MREGKKGERHPQGEEIHHQGQDGEVPGKTPDAKQKRLPSPGIA